MKRSPRGKTVPLRALTLLLAVLAVLAASPGSTAAAPDACEDVTRALNRALPAGIDEGELADVLRSLNATGDRKLPSKFVTKGKAGGMGWRPGRDLWDVPGLRGRSIGGDRFGNREGRLPRIPGGWREADLDYKGGRRGAKRIVYAAGGRRMITVDHYSTFREVPSCR